MFCSARKKKKNEESRSFVDCRMPRATLKQGMYKYVRLRNRVSLHFHFDGKKEEKERESTHIRMKAYTRHYQWQTW